MAKFEVTAQKVDVVKKHPNADRLSIFEVSGVQIVSANLEDGSPRYKVDEIVVYVPENASLPEYLLRKGFWNEKEGKGFLAGPKGDRVKPVKLRGEMSYGILFPFEEEEWEGGHMYYLKNEVGETWWFDLENAPDEEIIGTDVGEFLGITKWVPQIPETMAGDVYNVGIEYAVNFDVESLAKFKDEIKEGDRVTITEKLHGTCSIFGYIPEYNENLWDGHYFATSKTLAAKGLAIANTEENRNKNVYLKMGINKVFPAMKNLLKKEGQVPFLILGEIYGMGVQDLQYDLKDKDFKMFDVYFPTVKRYLTSEYLIHQVEYLTGLKTVPVHTYKDKFLHDVPFKQEYVSQESIGGKSSIGNNVREGVVVWKSFSNIEDEEWDGTDSDRKKFKVISEDYLTRKGGTEFN